MAGSPKSRSGAGGKRPAKRPTTTPVEGSANLPASVLAHGTIAVRAYHLWLERGGQPGDDIGDWLAAEQQLLAESGATAPRRRGKTAS